MSCFVGTCAHAEVKDEVFSVFPNVWDGMGLICLHSLICPKIFRHLTGTVEASLARGANGNASVRQSRASDRAESEYLLKRRMYGEPFMIALKRDCFLSWFEGGEVFRSGVTLSAATRIFLFPPGHENVPPTIISHVLKSFQSVYWQNRLRMEIRKHTVPIRGSSFGKKRSFGRSGYTDKRTVAPRPFFEKRIVSQYR